jgi:hypothetical protein
MTLFWLGAIASIHVVAATVAVALCLRRRTSVTTAGE